MQKVIISSINVPPRIRTDLGNLTELKEDIQQHGLLQPIVVSEINNREDDRTIRRKEDISSSHPSETVIPSSLDLHRYELIAGYRRLQAVQSLGWTEIPVTIIDTPASLAQFDMQLAENIKRKDLNPLEISEAIIERKHRFEQVHGKIENGGVHPTKTVADTRLPSGQTGVHRFYEETGELLNKSPYSIYKFLQLNELDPDLKDQVRNSTIGYRVALNQQAERNRNARPLQKKSNSKSKSFGLPNKEAIAPLQKQYQATPNLMKLFMLVQHTANTINQQQEKPLEYQKCELEFLFIFIQQLDFVIPYYQNIRKELNVAQEQKLNELTMLNMNSEVK